MGQNLFWYLISNSILGTKTNVRSTEQERFPYAEGWRTPKQPIDQALMNKTISHLIGGNEHKGQEAIMVGVGTIEALKTVVTSFVKVPSACTIM
jgi:hypothetical protein